MYNVQRAPSPTPCIPSERKSRAARPHTFSPPSSVASAFKERKKCFRKIQFCLSLPSPPFRPLNWSTSTDICILPLFLGFVFFPTLPTSEWPNRWTRSIQRRIPAVCFTHFPHICIKFEKLLSANTKFIPEKSHSLYFSIMCKGTWSQFSMVRITIFKRKSKINQKDTYEWNVIILYYNYWYYWYYVYRYKYSLIYIKVAWICRAQPGIWECKFAEENRCWVISKTNMISNIISKTNIACALLSNAEG